VEPTQPLRSRAWLAPRSVISLVSQIDLRVNALTRRLRWIIGRATGIYAADPQATVDQCIVSADAGALRVTVLHLFWHSGL